MGLERFVKQSVLASGLLTLMLSAASADDSCTCDCPKPAKAESLELAQYNPHKEPSSTYRRAFELALDKDYENSLAMYETAFKEAPPRTQLGVQSGELKKQITDLVVADAREEYKRVLEIGRQILTIEDSPAVHMFMAIAHRELGNTGEAYSEFIETAKIAPDFPEVYAGIARTTSNPDEAQFAWKVVLTLLPNTKFRDRIQYLIDSPFY